MMPAANNDPLDGKIIQFGQQPIEVKSQWNR